MADVIDDEYEFTIVADVPDMTRIESMVAEKTFIDVVPQVPEAAPKVAFGVGILILLALLVGVK